MLYLCFSVGISANKLLLLLGRLLFNFIYLFPVISNAEHTFGDHVISSYWFSVGFIAVVQATVSRMNVVNPQVGGIDHGVSDQEVDVVNDASIDIDVIEMLVSVCRVACIARPHDSRRPRCVAREYQCVTDHGVYAMIMV